MKILALLQAREGSERLPHKALLDINGMTMLEHIHRRLSSMGTIDGVVVSTSVESDGIKELCSEKKWKFWAGSESDLLSRHLGAALTYDADAILRVTGDCVFHDPAILDKMVASFKTAYRADACINWYHGFRTISEGLDAEIVTTDCMRALAQDRNCPREDWLTFLDRSPHYSVMGWAYPVKHGEEIHLSVDTVEDLERARKMMTILGNDSWEYPKTLKAWEMAK